MPDKTITELLEENSSFQDNYLRAARALDELDKALIVIGMAGNRAFAELRNDFVRHGATTARDIYKL